MFVRHGRSQTRRLTLALLGVALMLASSLATSTGVSANPALSVTPNPVILPAGQTSGTTTIAWDLSSVASCQCGVLIVDDGSGTPIKRSVTGKGSTVQQVFFGKIYIVSLTTPQGDGTLGSIRVDIEQKPSSGGGGPTVGNITLFPTKFLTSDNHYVHQSSDAWCVTALGTGGLGPPINVGGLFNTIVAGFSHSYDPGTNPFPCEEIVNDVFRGGVGFDMNVVNAFALGHGLKSANLLFRQDTGGLPCTDHIGINSDPWESLVPGSVSVLPDGTVRVSPQMAPITSGGFWGRADVLAPVALGVALGGDTHMHFVFVGPNEDLYAKDNNNCYSTISKIVLSLEPQH